MAKTPRKKELTVKKNILVIATICLATVAIAADQKEPKAVAAADSSQAITAHNRGDDSMPRTGSQNNDWVPNAKHAAASNVENQTEGDPEAPQNQVEYGGGG
jgi:hypothetical protein